MWVIKEWKESDGEHYIKVQLWTACCKEQITLRVDGEKSFFWLSRLEKTSPSLTEDIVRAIREWRAQGKKAP